MAKAVKKEEMPVLDKTDMAILKLLQLNARATVKEISEKVHLSTTPVHERIRRMETAGVIKQYVTLLNAAKIGKGLMVICYVSIKQHSKSAGDRPGFASESEQGHGRCFNKTQTAKAVLSLVAQA